MITAEERGDHSFSANDWFSSGWQAILPAHAFSLQMIVTTATALNVDGGIAELHNGHIGLLGMMLCADLDDPVTWIEEGVDDPESIVLKTQARARFEEALTAAGMPIPATLAELAETMAALGIFERTELDGGGERWRTPKPLPSPLDVLPFSGAFADDLRDRLRSSAAHDASQAIIKHLMSLAAPATLHTSVDRLAAAVGYTAAEIREGLWALTDDGDFRVQRFGVDVDPADFDGLAGHAMFQLVADWDLFSETRVHVSVGRTAEADTGDCEPSVSPAQQ